MLFVFLLPLMLVNKDYHFRLAFLFQSGISCSERGFASGVWYSVPLSEALLNSAFAFQKSVCISEPSESVHFAVQNAAVVVS